MRKSSGLILKLVVVFYALILTFCNSNENNTPISKKSYEVYSSLTQEYDAILLSDHDFNFTNDLLSTLIERPVVMDTVVIGAYHKHDKFYLKTFVSTGKDAAVCALLNCSEEIYNEYLYSGLTSFIIAAKITKIETGFLLADCETIDNDFITLYAGNEMLLTGDCIALCENPEKKDLVLKNLN